MTRLEVRNLHLGYHNLSIIENLNLEIFTGKITVLVGVNGCGKSTLLRGLARLLPPLEGKVYLDGKAITQLPTKLVAQKLGILPQNPSAPEGFTVRDLVSQGRYPYQSWRKQWSQQDDYWVEQALVTTEMLSLSDRSLDSLSGGQRQRAWIAMALAQNTDILLLDEPTTFLDLAHQIEVLDLLTDLNQNLNRTIIMVLHDLNLASRYADYLIALNSGRIYAYGTPQEVMTVETIEAVFGLACCIISDPITQTPLCLPLSRKLSSKN